MSAKKPVYVVQHNHFDPIWRRCWDRPFDYQGKRYSSYAQLEQMVFDIWLESAKRGATFSEGQSVVVRKYLERRPEALPAMRDLVKRGLMEITAAGETVADTNMPAGETLLRNLVMGQLWFDDVFGVTPSVGWLEDAFGQSAQIPQIFRGCEVKHAVKLSYKQVPGDYWRGLDGSVIFTGDVPQVHYAGSCYKIPPCPECSGMGCATCADTGFDGTGRILDEHVRNGMSQDYSAGDPFSMLLVGGEESIPNPNLPELVAEAQSKSDAPDFRWGTWANLAREYADAIAKVDDPDIEVSDEVEANPVSTGCYVTRIGIKQAFRRTEHLLVAAEKWATVAWLKGGEYPAEDLVEAWRNLLFVAFHDAITSTHINAAYFELMDMFSEAESRAETVLDGALGNIEARLPVESGGRQLVIYNAESWERDDLVTADIPRLQGVPALRDASSGAAVQVLSSTPTEAGTQITFRPPAVPALGYRILAIEAADVASSQMREEIGSGDIENEFFRVRASDRGIVSILDRRTGREVLSTEKCLANELVLEEDVGHPWGTMKLPESAEGLSKYTTNVAVRRSDGVGEIALTGEYTGNDPNVRELRWTQEVRLYKGSPRIDFHTEIDWDTAQRRIRVAFPTAIRPSEATYAVPYGALARGTYEPDMTVMPSTNGDWPAINWVDVHDDKESRGVGLLNAGTPSHKVADGVIFMSVLRSPTDSWCLNEPEYYDCPDFDGARDAGHHVFRYALVPHAGDWRDAGLERMGREFNTPMVAHVASGRGDGSLPACHPFLKLDAPPNVIVSAIKKSEKDDCVVVRLAETDGGRGSASVGLEGTGGPAALVNFIERGDRPVSGAVELAPFKIVTVKLPRES